MTEVQELMQRISIDQITDSSLKNIAQTVFVGQTEITKDDLLFLMEMDLSTTVAEINISAAETRQVAQYENNNYYVGMKLDTTDTHRAILDRVKRAAPGEEVVVFQQSKRAFYAFVQEKYIKNENFLRELIHDQQLADGISPK